MPSRSTTFIGWLLLAVVALIAYGSLYPFNLKPDVLHDGVLEAVRELSWARAGRSDRIANVLLYLPLGFCLLLWLERRLRRAAAVMLAVLFGALLSVLLVPGEHIGPEILAAVALVTAGTIIVNREGKKRSI